MDSKTIDYYLEELTESAWNTNLIKNKREIHANVVFHIRKNSTQLFYEYRMEKIHRFKAFLKCRVAKCSSRLIVNYGNALTTEKNGSQFKFCSNVTRDMLLDTASHNGLAHKCSKW